MPDGLTLDGAGNLYIADFMNGRIRKVSPVGIVTTVAGGGTAVPGDGGPATAAQLGGPHDVAVDAAGNLYVADAVSNQIRKISPAGVITTAAGNGSVGYAGDGGLSTGASLGRPWRIAVDQEGNLYIADYFNYRIRKVANGIITTVAGNGMVGDSGDGGPATSASIGVAYGLSVDAAGNLYFSNGVDLVWKVSTDGIIHTAAGNGLSGFAGDGGSATAATLFEPEGVAVDGNGNLYIADNLNYRIRRVSESGIITTVAGDGTVGDGGPAADAWLFNPIRVAVDSQGNLYIADDGHDRVRKVSTSGIITTVAGDGTLGDSGDGGPAVSAQLSFPASVALDAAGNLYIAVADGRIRKVAPSGIITTIAGGGTTGLGDGGPAIAAALSDPQGVAVDGAGNLYIADSGNQRVRKVTPAGTITTVAGTGTAGYSGDGGPAIGAQLSSPWSVSVDGAGNLYIADLGNSRIRRVSPSGIITTVAGGGTSVPGDGDLATKAQLGSFQGIAVDGGGNLYIAEVGANRVRRVSPAGVLATVAGNGTAGYSGDGGVAPNAQLNQPTGVAVDAAGDLYVADFQNHSVRLLQPDTLPPAITSVTNGASNLPGPIAPGEVVVLKGADLGPVQHTQYQLTNAGFLNTAVNGTVVLFNGNPGPIIYTSFLQVAAIVPYSVSSGTAQVTVNYQGRVAPAVSVPVSPSAPGLFTLDTTGAGAAAVLNQNYSVNTPGNPAKVGEYISIYATGEGQTTPAGVDGKVASPIVPPYPPRPNLPVTVTIGGKTVTPVYVGGAPGSVAGLLQINAQIPSGIQTGSAVPVTIQIGNATSQQGVTIAVQ